MSNLKKNVAQIRKARGLTQAELSLRLGMAEADLVEFLQDPPNRKETTISKLARELVVPEVLLFVEGAQVTEAGIPDFRLSQPTSGGYSRETLRWIEFASTVARTAHSLHKGNKSRSLSKLIAPNAAIPLAAARLREILALTNEFQIKCESPQLLFGFLRQKIEELNVFVLQLSFPERDGTGFCICGDVYDVIVINTRNQAPARRSFTLAHEIYHCVLGKSGVSDTRIANNAIERRCNSFAAHFLAPDNLVRHAAKLTIKSRSLVLDELRRVAGAISISMYATLLRLVELGIYSEGAIAAWHQYIKTKGDPEAPRARGGTRVEEWKYKLSKYGFKFASMFGDAKAKGKFDDLEFYQFSGIRPKYQNDYISHASSGRPEDAAFDEGDGNA